MMFKTYHDVKQIKLFNIGGIVVRILHHEGQVHDGCIFVAMRLFGEKAA